MFTQAEKRCAAFRALVRPMIELLTTPAVAARLLLPPGARTIRSMTESMR